MPTAQLPKSPEANKVNKVNKTKTIVLLISLLSPVALHAAAPAPTPTPTQTPAPTQFFTSTAYTVPHDAPAPLPANQSSQQLTNLATFAWQEFIALNWPSSYDAKAHIRGKPDTTKLPLDFAQPDNAGDLVWQTYKHRVEVYPDGATAANYDSSFNTTPKYDYRGGDGKPIYACGDYTPGKNGQLGTWTADTSSPDVSQVPIFNNLDETSEINLCTLFTSADPNAPGVPPAKTDINNLFMGLPQQPRRFIYEAKANQVMFDYVAGNNYFLDDSRLLAQQATYNKVRKSGAGGVAPCPTLKAGEQSIVCFPPGDSSPNGSEGTILVKATWKQLTQAEYSSGRYLTAPIIRYRILDVNTDISNSEASESDDTGDFCYEKVPPTPTATTLPYGLVGLHIIHKTTNYPTYVFATFEQADNLNTTLPNNDLYYYNRNILPPANKDKQNVTTRAHPMSDATKNVNDQVHLQLRNLLAANKQNTNDSVWLYYKLVGVQGAATDSGNTSNTDYFLANVVTETSEILRSFSGTLDNTNGTINPTVFNIHKGSTTYTGGGCKGCHGNAQVGPAPNTVTTQNPPIASDFSFITQGAPITTPDGINQPLFKEDQKN